MTYSFYFHNDVTGFQRSKESHCIDRTSQGDSFGNAGNENTLKEQTLGYLVGISGKEKQLSLFLKYMQTGMRRVQM